ncbi:hypothetical protein RBB50_009186 [Rhinocladiella similis]
MPNLPPLPAPGLAILPRYLSDRPLTVILKGSSFSRSMTATTGDGLLLFSIEGQALSRSHRRSFLDANGQKLFEIREEGIRAKHYYAALEENGPRLFETETHVKIFRRSRTSVRFANQADPNRQMVELEFVQAGLGEDGSLTWSGGQVALVEKISFTMSGEYRLSVSPGMDPALVVAVTIAMIDRAKTQASRNAGAGAGAGVAS